MARRIAKGRVATLSLLFILVGVAAPLDAQQTDAPRANWTQAERFSSSSLNTYLHSSSVNPQFIDEDESDEFWYRFQDAEGTRWMRVNPAGPSRVPLFDHALMARLLTETLGNPVDRQTLDLSNLEFTEDLQSIRFEVDDTHLEFHLTELTLVEYEPEEDEDEPRNWREFSPDSTAYVFARGHNLYFVEMEDEDTVVQLTDDGEEYYSFGFREVDDEDEEEERREEQEEHDEQDEDDMEEEVEDPFPHRVRPNVTWSEDSQRFYVTRNDSREVKELHLVNSLTEPRPELMSYRYAMPGEEDVTQVELHLFDRPTVVLRELDVAKWKDQRLFNIHWPLEEASSTLRLVRRDRPQRTLELIEVRLDEGDEIRVLLTESTENAHLRRQNVRYVDDGGDFLWQSRRTGWSHYYRYDYEGNLRNVVTEGEWNAEAIVELDSIGGEVFVRGVGREEGENPYYSHLYRVGLDGSGINLMDPGDANHNSRVTPSFRFAVNNYSRVDMAPQSVLRNRNGDVILELEQMDLSRIEEMGWQMPETFVVKAADGVTDIYGNMWKPFDFDPDSTYPIIAHVYPGPQTESVSSTFSAANQRQELAQLGFIVIQIGNRGGSPQRSAAYHSFGYFDLRDYGLADKKAGIEQLAAVNSWIDLDNVGIYGHSGGGFMTAAALLLPPYNQFFKAGASSAGNHDNNVYNQNWSEQHHGLTVESCENDEGEEEDCFTIEVPTNHELAENLEGRLLLVHGDMDNNVHHAGTMRLAKALIDANKRFDFMMFPGMAHGFGGYSSYWQRMMFEFFAESLMGDYYRHAAPISN